MVDYGILGTIINSFDFGASGYLMPIIIVALCAIAITRNTRHLRIILFPLAVGFARIGLEIHWTIVVLTATTWITTIVGSHLVGSVLQSTGEVVEKIGRTSKYVMYKQGLRKAEIANNIDAGTTDLQVERGLRAFDIGDAIDKGTYFGQIQRGIRASYKRGEIDKATIQNQIDSATRAFQVQDQVDQNTFMGQIRKNIRGKRKAYETDRLSGNIDDTHNMLNKQRTRRQEMQWNKWKLNKTEQEVNRNIAPTYTIDPTKILNDGADWKTTKKQWNTPLNNWKRPKSKALPEPAEWNLNFTPQDMSIQPYKWKKRKWYK